MQLHNHGEDGMSGSIQMDPEFDNFMYAQTCSKHADPKEVKKEVNKAKAGAKH